MMETKPEAVRPAENWNWVWGAILIVLGGVALVNQFVGIPFMASALFWSAMFAAGGVAFASVYLRNRANWWALIPAYALFVIAILITAGTVGINGKAIGVFVMLATGLPFLLVYLINRDRWWALIPAYVTIIIAGIIGLSELSIGAWMAAYVLMAIALPFYVVFFRDNRKWWALIPAYTMTAVAAIPILGDLGIGNWLVVYIMTAIALPFYAVFFRNRKHWWALIPAAIMTMIAFGFAVSSVEYIVPVGLILIGIFLLSRQYLGRGSAEPPAPLTGPEADKPKTG